MIELKVVNGNLLKGCVDMELTVIIILFLLLVVFGMFRALWKSKKRKGNGGFKTYLTGICLFMVAAIQIVSSWYEIGGILLTLTTFFLLLLAAYYTKYLQQSDEQYKKDAVQE
ncbi:MAG: hypothetical protein ACI35P_15805 [Bacillus sp. (in: firmicutes)]